MIDRNLNYGRHHIHRFAQAGLAGQTQPMVLDIGAGNGKDLLEVRRAHSGAKLHALEGWPPNLETLKNLGVAAQAIDLERERFPFADETFDFIVANQVLEHFKEIFWVLHEVS